MLDDLTALLIGNFICDAMNYALFIIGGYQCDNTAWLKSKQQNRFINNFIAFWVRAGGDDNETKLCVRLIVSVTIK